MSRTSTEVLRRIYDDETGAFIQVSPNGEIPGILEVTVTGEESLSYFGACALSLHKSKAEALGKALIAAAAECEE